ncbi:uncharacterized protein LOC131048458 [Cryptomeria japonica]|uniref:uncharacterized protein LOC131048458 n=1 Tax=Cryptomeria japonica TaxID=3369 RepID=UPI0027DA87B0|nr:uncharacterized protein LOC131048458 [Cryptomeria japonica]XP_059063943.1 uncharacterized protein LOC131048458 [Cryptomeria japonica]
MAAYKTRAPSYLLLLILLAFALVSFLSFQKMRDLRLANDLIGKKEAEIESLREDLQREREASDQMREKLKDLHMHTDILRSEKASLSRQLTEMEMMKNSIEEGKNRLLSSLQNKEDQIAQLKEQERMAFEQKNEVQTLTELLDKKEHEINDMKSRLAEFEGVAGKSENNTVEKLEAGKSMNNTLEKIEPHKPDDDEKPQFVNTIGNMSAEDNYTYAATEDRSDRVRQGNREEDFFEGRAMESVEKSALGDRVGTTTNGSELHDAQFEKSTELHDRRIRNEEDDDKDNLEEETEAGIDNSDEMKDLDDLEDNNDDKDPEDEQGEENDKVNEEEEIDI